MSVAIKSPLSPENWPFGLENLPESAYLVGGAVRDALLSRTVGDLDLDFVVLSEAVNTAKTIASHYKAGFVLLDADRQIARVVFPGVTVDFAQAEGESLEVDLGRRDFTINAIAYHPITKTVFDPYQGQQDLQQGMMRMISRENLADDPLRLLRGYRQAAQLGFVIEPETKQAIADLASLLPRVAAERIRTELGYLLNTPLGVPKLIAAWKIGLLSPWFSSLGDRCDRLKNLDHAATIVSQTYPPLAKPLRESVRNTIKMSQLAIAKLATMTSEDPSQAEAELITLKYSRVEIRGVLALLRTFQQLQPTPIADLSIRQQYFLFATVGEFFPALVVLSIAAGASLQEFTTLINHYLNPDDAIAHPQPVISGKLLMTKLGLSPGPLLGDLLQEVQIANAEGQISTPEDAIAIASQKMLEFKR
ncbi:MAG: CCA tRNA nucleotidyltransferase [Arthrospira sp. PLM2.Bin9]|nr:CCA tRNA nucleotidyltransferase [Arthrospira sp. PLM2.Bin9]TVU53054.1 MAG: CCA tRNA nucleotidyltransferase [Arthrospira sp. PLM2.Bin9]